jgi:hypothetical protein
MRAIQIADYATVNCVLDRVNGHAHRFVIHSATEVEAIAKRAVDQFDAHELPLRLRGGAVITYRPAGPMANAYRYAPISTRVKLRVGCDGKAIYIIGVERVRVYPTQRASLTISLKRAAHGDFVRRQSKIFDALPMAEQRGLASS